MMGHAKFITAHTGGEVPAGCWQGGALAGAGCLSGSARKRGRQSTESSGLHQALMAASDATPLTVRRTPEVESRSSVGSALSGQSWKHTGLMVVGARAEGQGRGRRRGEGKGGDGRSGVDLEKAMRLKQGDCVCTDTQNQTSCGTCSPARLQGGGESRQRTGRSGGWRRCRPMRTCRTKRQGKARRAPGRKPNQEKKPNQPSTSQPAEANQ